MAKKYLPRGFGGVLSFGVKGGQDTGSQVIDDYKLILNLTNYVSAISRGCRILNLRRTVVLRKSQCWRFQNVGYSSVDHYARAAQRQRKDQRRRNRGLVRISVETGHIDDIIHDFEQPFAASQAAKPDTEANEENKHQTGTTEGKGKMGGVT